MFRADRERSAFRVPGSRVRGFAEIDPVQISSVALRDVIHDMGHNEAWVSAGCDHDTPVFAVASLRRCWEEMGPQPPRPLGWIAGLIDIYADVPIPLQIFQQGFRGPLMAGRIPMAIMGPTCIAQLSTLTADVVALIDDGNIAIRSK